MLIFSFIYSVYWYVQWTLFLEASWQRLDYRNACSLFTVKVEDVVPFLHENKTDKTKDFLNTCTRITLSK